MTHPAGNTGQPLADQPTVEVPLDRYAVPYDVPAHPGDGDRYEDDADRYGDQYEDDGERYDDRYGDEAGDRSTDDGAEDEFVDDEAGWSADHGPAPVAVRRADTLAGLALLLAGMSAGISLLVVWVNGGATGLEQVRDGLADAGDGAAALGAAGTWQPLAVVGGGIVLLLLGLLMYAPARTHRLLGALALLASLVVAAGVLVPLADLDWELDRLAVGACFTVAAGALGLIGALKALSTGPRCTR
jgi:hypothetical protein